ncbi:hypothetical protein E4U56_002109 [Claviceps arundinis]|uniref:Uncharacterized protein n=1 Tax=Claviceps arundinis TaxID=1623583 RepID=A0A9P7SP07_9HYPO|nr:hypothetical protein E4U56_002109 [Claviceps arundinis]
MKLVSLSLIALAASQTAVAFIAKNTWKFSGNPSGGLRDVTFPFKMAGAAHKSGYYFAQQFNFQNISRVGYCGIQSRPNGTGGKSIVHAVFSTFQGNSTTQHSKCHMGADGSPAGVSCAVEFPGSYDAVYNVVVEHVQGTTWKGTAINNSTGESFHIGSWTLPSTAGGIKSNQLGFVEYYPWNSRHHGHECHDLPRTAVTMFDPYSKTPGAGTGRTNKPYESGDCVGKVAFSTEKVANGYGVQCGF